MSHPFLIPLFRVSRSAPFAVHLGLVIVMTVASTAADRSTLHAVFKSNDRARTWTRSDKGLPGNARINAFESLNGKIVVGTDSGIFHSRDSGQSWGPARIETKAIGRILCLATAGSKIYAGTDLGGLLVSADSGSTWNKALQFPVPYVRCLLSLDRKIYAGTDADGVFVSRTDGNDEHWDQLDHGFPARIQVFALAPLREQVFAGTYTQGLYSWQSSDREWKKCPKVVPLALANAGNRLVAGHNPGGLFWSDDAGLTWSKGKLGVPQHAGFETPFAMADEFEHAPVWQLASSATLTMAGAGSGIFYSEDGGRSWIRAQHGLPDKCPGISFHIQENQILAATLIEANP